MNCNKQCDVLWAKMYIWYDGTCNPCDFDYKSMLKVGNVKEASLQDIWLGDIYNKYRDLFLQGKRRSINPCSNCNSIV
jgi:radical SAM protein with 4Fe4S-binding SPASM domain